MLLKKADRVKFKVVTWNMDHWKRTKKQNSAAWDYLIDQIDADIMLLQEFSPPGKIEEKYTILYEEIGGDRPWGSAIVTKDFDVEKVEFDNSYVGGVIVGEITSFTDDPLTVISMYGTLEEKYATASMHRVLSDLTKLLHEEKNKRLFVVGGDYNLSKQWDDRYNNKDPSHEIFFDRLEDFGLVNCTSKYFGKHVQTNRHSNSDFP